MLSRMLGGAPLWLWFAFHILLFALLLLDFALTRGYLPHRVVERRSYWLTGCWVSAALLFAILIHRVLSARYALEYLTGYGVEEALSIDNLFVFLVLFRMLRLPAPQQRRVLFFGVLGAIVLRALMIVAGIGLLDTFRWMNYVFGAILLLTAWHLVRESSESETEEPPRAIRWLLNHLPIASSAGGSGSPELSFLKRENGHWRMTPMLVALIAIEATDALFATDSVPAVLAVSHHPFVVYSSNIFAVLGLRSLYFTLAAALSRLNKLHYGLAAILVFVGLKMMLARFFAPPVWASLVVVAGLVGIATAWSLVSGPSTPARTRDQS